MNQKGSTQLTTSMPEERRRVIINLPATTLAWIDNIRQQRGFRSKGAIIEQLLIELQERATSREHSPSGALTRLAHHMNNFSKQLKSKLFPR